MLVMPDELILVLMLRVVSFVNHLVVLMVVLLMLLCGKGGWVVHFSH